MTNKTPPHIPNYRYTFQLSDESENSYGFITLTKGIDLKRFYENPLMLYEHNREQVIGRWENSRIEGNQLLAETNFDTEDEKALSIAKKVEKGYLKGVSMGLFLQENALQYLPNGKVIAHKSQLLECSICSIPSNRNALKLYSKEFQPLSKKEELQLLSYNPSKYFFMNFNKEDNMPPQNIKLIYDKLGVTHMAAALDKIETLLQQSKELGEIRKKEAEQEKQETEQLLQQALAEKKIHHSELPRYKKLAALDRELIAELLDNLSQKERISDVPQPLPTNTPKPLDFHQLRKEKPAYLIRLKKEEPHLYAELVPKYLTQTFPGL